MSLSKPPHEVVATVLGAGTMGAGIAAHLAAAGCRTHLLDIVPEGATGGARSGIAAAALKALKKSRPPALMSQSVLQRLTPGNLEDDLHDAVSRSDLVIEAVVERLDIKSGLFAKVAAAAQKGCVLATNTSGIPIDSIAAKLPEDARRRFLGLHFFNPPRWMHLLEVIPGGSTDPQVVREATQFCDVALGKGVVQCRDTPNFIGNRIGIAEMLFTFDTARALNLTVEEIDLLNGPLTGRPKTGSCRLGDMVGLDIVSHVIKNLEDGLSADQAQDNFDPYYSMLKVPAVIEQLVQSKRLGDKTGAGFYRKTKDEQGRTKILSLDFASMDYRERRDPVMPELDEVSRLPLKQRVAAVLRLEGKVGEFQRGVLLRLFNYAAHLAGVICESPDQIDAAMRFGYGWELGPFELLDAAGPAWVAQEIQQLGAPLAPGLETLLAESRSGFYQEEGGTKKVWVPRVGSRPVSRPEGAIFLSDSHPIAMENPSCRVLDIGDGIACLEFRSKANVLDDGVVNMVSEAPTVLHEKGFRGLVVGNQAPNFCRGANLVHIGALIAKKDFDGVEAAVKALQDAFMNLRHGPIPVVAAPIGQALGGGTEICLHCEQIEAGADLFMGLVEIGVGVLPAGGGLKEIARRASRWAAQVPEGDAYHWVRRGFEAAAGGRVSGSAFEAREAGFLAATDGVTFHKSRVIQNAKKRALGLAAREWAAPSRGELFEVVGREGGANMMMGAQLFQWAGYASDYDKQIASKMVHVLTGGMGSRRMVVAQEILDLEREAFVSLCGDERTQARIEHMLKTKKPLRN